jgi:uncharacterized membrane protein
VAAVVLGEALLVGGYGVYLAVETVVAPATERGAAVFLAVTALALAAGLAGLARAVAAGRRRSRAPVLVWQVLQASVGWQVAGAAARKEAGWAAWALAVTLLLACLVAGVGILRRDVVPIDPLDNPQSPGDLSAPR